MSSTFLRSPAFAAACVLGVAIVASTALRVGATPAPAQATPTSVAVVNLQVINQLAELKDLNDGVSARAAQYQKTIDGLNDEIKAIKNELDNTIPKTDRQRRMQREADMYLLMQRKESSVKAFSELLNIDQGAVLMALHDKLVATVSALAQKEGYDLVLVDDTSFHAPERATDDQVSIWARQRSILYRNSAIDLTDRVLTIMNNEYAAGKGPASLAPGR